ncbi:hypothetical protein [Mycobacterium sp. NPDC050041]|uniref:hypothetical protein n=1 Tax=Mycobacterium sp. NPDC050041 TaxID=3364293 RepID=UPI003C2E4FE6
MKLAEILAQHAPYLSKNSANKLCLRCLDDTADGEFETVEAWAEHVAREVRRAGYARTSARVEPGSTQGSLL